MLSPCYPPELISSDHGRGSDRQATMSQNVSYDEEEEVDLSQIADEEEEEEEELELPPPPTVWAPEMTLLLQQTLGWFAFQKGNNSSDIWKNTRRLSKLHPKRKEEGAFPPELASSLPCSCLTLVCSQDIHICVRTSSKRLVSPQSQSQSQSIDRDSAGPTVGGRVPYHHPCPHRPSVWEATA